MEILPVMCRKCETLISYDAAHSVNGTFFCKHCSQAPQKPTVNWFAILWGVGCLIIGLGGLSYCQDQMQHAAQEMYNNYSVAKILMIALGIFGAVELLFGFFWSKITSLSLQ